MTHAPADIQDVLQTAVCPHMARAYRNRSVITRRQWTAYADALLNFEWKRITDLWRLGGCLYAACSDYTRTRDEAEFVGANLTSTDYEVIAILLKHFLLDPPDYAIMRGEWDDRQRECNENTS